MTAKKKDAPVGVDIFYREIFAGDTVRDADGKEYTVDGRGWARPLDGGSGCGFKRLKDPVFVAGPAKPVPADPAPVEAKPAPTAPVSDPAFDPAPVEPAPQAEELRPVHSPRRVKTGGKPNTTGHSQLCAFAQRHFVPAKVARQILLDHGIPVYTRGKNTKTHFPSERIEEVRQLLDDWAAAHPEMHKDKVVHTRLSYIARKAGISMRELHRRCLVAGIPVISDPAYNKSVHPQDALRVLALAKGEPMPIVAIEPAEVEEIRDGAGVIIVPPIQKFSDDEIFQEAKRRGIWPDDTPVQFAEASDQYLADELRRRGFQLTCVKRIEL